MRLVFESNPVLIDGVVAYLLTKTMCRCYACISNFRKVLISIAHSQLYLFCFNVQ
jgi:hypothetical protein